VQFVLFLEYVYTPYIKTTGKKKGLNLTRENNLKIFILTLKLNSGKMERKRFIPEGIAETSQIPSEIPIFYQNYVLILQT
jgi:hypothetical protein